jgi:hypothetical protein
MDKKSGVLVGLFLIGYFIVLQNSVPLGIVAHSGQYSKEGKYVNLSPLKEDFIKNFFVFAMLFYLFDPSFQGKELFDIETPFSTILGRSGLIGLLFGLYHIYVQPVLNFIPII